MNGINAKSPVLESLLQKNAEKTPVVQQAQEVEPTLKNDCFECSCCNKEENNMKIGFFRIIFRRLTDAQINEVNRTGQLPPNAKFDRFGGIHNNFFSITRGTRTMPAGYELKKGIFGFTHLVLKDTKGWLIKDAKPTPKE